jgi:cytochrome c biogenesis protein CcdA
MAFPKLWETAQDFIERYWSFKPIQREDNGFVSGFMTGISLGAVWTPCVGPIVATVATLVAANAFSLIAVLLIFSYALGTGFPLYLIARGGRTVSQKLTFFRKNHELVRSVFGAVILLTAIMIFFGIDRAIQTWTIDVLPSFWTQLASTFENALHVSDDLRQLKK